MNADNNSEYIIELNDVSFAFRQEKRNLPVLKDISLRIQKNEFVSIVGPSGCGKTTLLKAIGDLYDTRQGLETSGSILINGKSPQASRENYDIGFAFQNPILLPWRRVIGNVTLPKEIIGAPNRKFWDPVELLETMGLREFSNAYPRELSGGMQQRVAIARSLIYQPPILLMDEPFGALDASTREDLNMELLRIWRLTDATVLFVTHSISEAIFLSDRVLVLSRRPARIQREIRVEIARPRTINLKETVEFIKYSKMLREELEKARE